MIQSLRLRNLARWSLAIVCLVLCHSAVAQMGDRKLQNFILPSPLKFELSQSFNPWAPAGRYSADHFRLSGDMPWFGFTYSNQAPAIAAGRQFQAFPAGYELTDFKLGRKWGSVQAFRSTGFNSRMVRPSSARSFAGVGVDLKNSLGGELSGYALQGASAGDDTSAAPPGSQTVLSYNRNIPQKFKLQTEWSQSWQDLAANREPASGHGLFVKLSGDVFKANTTVSYRSQGEGLANPVAPAQGRGRNLITVDVSRSYKAHQLQYTSQRDSHKELRFLHLPSTDTHQKVLTWTYTPKVLPRVSAARVWTQQNGGGKHESEENLRLSLNTGIKSLKVGLAFLRGTRIDELEFRPLWERTGLAGDASLQIMKDRSLNVHYEMNELTVPATSQLLSSEALQLNTRLAFLEEKLAVLPALDYRHQRDSRGTLNSSLLNLVISAIVKIPRYLPGNELLFNFSSHRLTAIGTPDRHSAALTIQWNLKRM
jgi:hypothetical protein